MICNIIDHRKRPYRWRNIDAIVEPTWHDNSVKDSDIMPRTRVGEPSLGYEEKLDVSVDDAIVWADEFEAAVTLYLYDAGEATRVVRRG